MKDFIEFIKKSFSFWRDRSIFKPSDSGLFDPFVPSPTLKTIDNDFHTDTDPEQPAQVYDEIPLYRPTYLLFKILILVIGAVLTIRLIGLQITNGEENFSRAKGNSTRTQATVAPRGLIYDRKGTPLVNNVPSFSVVLTTADFPPKKADSQAYIAKLSSALNLNAETLKQEISSQLAKKNKPPSVTLLDSISRDDELALELKLQGINGVEIAKVPSRFYSDLPSLGHLVGYIGKATADDLKDRPNLLPISLVGKTGLEKTYDDQLQGRPGTEINEVDSVGRAIRSIGTTSPIPGKSLLLSIDSNLQKVSAQALSDSIQKSGATSGAAVTIDVHTGDILSMVSFPTFDNNIFSSSIDPAKRDAILKDPGAPLLNRAIAGQYPSGSTIKPVIASAGLQEHVITPDTKLDTSAGKIVLGQWVFPDWKTHGITDVRQALAESNNIFFYAVGGGYKNIGGLGVDRLDTYLKKFGFGQKTGIDLPGEAAGLVPTPDWKMALRKESWFFGDTYHLAIGQGDLLVTPLQMARSVAAIANGGSLIEPRLVRGVIADDGKQQADIAPVIRADHLVDPSVLQTVREGMRLAVTNGSARALNTLSVPLAAKTGTAQFDTTKNKTHSWFTAFGPYDNPQIAVAVIVEGGGEGFSVAGPVAKNILEQYFNLPLSPINPKPDQIID